MKPGSFLAAVPLVLLPMLPQSATAAPDNGNGMAIMAARVAINGTLTGGSGAVTAAKITTGSYSVTFDRDVTECFYSVTGGATPLTPVAFGQNSTEVGVTTYDEGVPADGGFYLLVYCPR